MSVYVVFLAIEHMRVRVKIFLPSMDILMWRYIFTSRQPFHEYIILSNLSDNDTDVLSTTGVGTLHGSPRNTSAHVASILRKTLRAVSFYARCFTIEEYSFIRINDVVQISENNLTRKNHIRNLPLYFQIKQFWHRLKQNPLNIWWLKSIPGNYCFSTERDVRRRTLIPVFTGFPMETEEHRNEYEHNVM